MIKRIFAILGIIFIIAIIVLTFVAAIFAKPGSSLFMGMITTVILLPIIAYGYIGIIKFSTSRINIKNYDDFDDNTCNEDIIDDRNTNN